MVSDSTSLFTINIVLLRNFRGARPWVHASTVVVTLAAGLSLNLAFKPSHVIHSTVFRHILCLSMWFLRFDVLQWPALHLTLQMSQKVLSVLTFEKCNHIPFGSLLLPLPCVFVVLQHFMVCLCLFENGQCILIKISTWIYHVNVPDWAILANFHLEILLSSSDPKFLVQHTTQPPSPHYIWHIT